MTRIPHAETFQRGHAITAERTAWFFFQYDWQTRDKKVWEKDMPDVPLPEKNEELQRLYRVQVRLPIPTFADQRKEVHVVGHALFDEGDYFSGRESLAYQIGRRFFSGCTRTIPETSPDNPLDLRWSSSPGGEKGVFNVYTKGRKFKVTVEEVER